LLPGFANMKALFHWFYNHPEKASRPFDKKRDGFVMGEGAGGFCFRGIRIRKKTWGRDFCEVAPSA